MKRLLVEKNKESDNRWLVMCLPPEINDLQLMSKEETLHKRKKNYNSKNKENKEKDQHTRWKKCNPVRKKKKQL